MFVSAMEDEIAAAYESHVALVDEADKVTSAFELAQQLTDLNELQNVRSVQV